MTATEFEQHRDVLADAIDAGTLPADVEQAILALAAALVEQANLARQLRAQLEELRENAAEWKATAAKADRLMGLLGADDAARQKIARLAREIPSLN